MWRGPLAYGQATAVSTRELMGGTLCRPGGGADRVPTALVGGDAGAGPRGAL
jgi:hypothetical protein